MLSCNCLNIIIESETKDYQKVTPESLNLTEEEREDVFFKQEIKQVEKLGRISKEHSGLVLSRSVGNWITHQCLNCEIHTHAIHRDRGATCVLVSSTLLSDEKLANLRKNELFSNIFNIIVPQRKETSGELEFEKYSPDVQLALGGLKQRAAEIITRESAVVEERIQQFTDQEYTALNYFKERARREQQILTSIILEKRYQPLDSPNNYTMPTPSPTARLPIEKVPVPNFSPSDKIKNKLLTFNKNNINRKAVRQMSTPTSNENLDSEGLFQFEELEDINQEPLSDPEESDNEENSRAETARTSRSKSQTSIAKSLPVNIPVFLSTFRERDVDDDEVLVSDDHHPSDIAASIKALAKSVHGDTVFGDLPRPRFSTQI